MDSASRAARSRCAGARSGVLAVALLWFLVGAAPTGAHEIEGVLPTSIGLPEVNVVVRPSAGAPPYSGLDSFAFPFTNLRMVYDTGASGMILYEGPATALGLPVAQFMGSDVTFDDVGVGGSTTFDVSDPLHVSFGNFKQDPPDPYTSDADYPRQIPGLRWQLGPPGSAVPFLSDFTLLGIAGMPAFAGRVSVILPKRAEVSFSELTPADTIHTYVYDPGVPAEEGPGIITPDVRVELTMKAFDRFTETLPAGATGPTLSENPFIGPDPLAALEGGSPPTSPPGIKLFHGANQVTGTFLLDTGAQITSVSSAIALSLGVRYWQPGDPGYDPGNPATLVYDADASLVPDQFTVTIGGIAGTETIAGFNVDSLLIRTMEGDPGNDFDPNHLAYLSAPVFVHDIELLDPVTLDTFTFDGILGTNYLIASGDLSALSGFDVPFRTAPFRRLVIDFASPTPSLGVLLPPAVPVSPVLRFVIAGALLLVGFAGAQGRAHRSRSSEAGGR